MAQVKFEHRNIWLSSLGSFHYPMLPKYAWQWEVGFNPIIKKKQEIGERIKEGKGRKANILEVQKWKQQKSIACWWATII